MLAFETKESETHTMNLEGYTFYTFPWGYPNIAIVETGASFYDVRGERDQITGELGHLCARDITETIEEEEGDFLEIEEEEILREFDEDELEAIIEAIEREVKDHATDI